MAIAELISKLRTKKQAAARSAFGHYLGLVRDLASGSEIDADEAGHILAAAAKTETDIERDVATQVQRNAWHSTKQRNAQAVADEAFAQRDVATAQAALQAAHDRLLPAVTLAHARLADARFRASTSGNADEFLGEHILDHELLEREQAVVVQLRDVQIELKPLVEDRSHKLHSLGNAEFHADKLSGRNPDDWLAWGVEKFFHKNQDMRKADSRVADLQSQVAQLNSAIAPRQAEQARLQAELNSIHQQKLEL